MISGGSLSSAPISSLAPSLPDVAATLAWLPHVPSFVPHDRLYALPMRSFYVSNLVPIPIPPPPTEYAAFVTLPTQVFRRTLPTVARPFYVSGSPFLGTSLRARSIGPSRFLTRRPLLRPAQTFEIGAVLDIPKTGGWRPRLVSRLVARSRISFGGGVWLVDPGTLLNAAPCVELGTETLTNPILADETLINPAFGSEALTLPTIGSEDLC